MPRNPRSHFTLLALALLWPLAAHAQFQPPTDEELKMTAEPNAPGAAAIYLYREESDDDNLHYHGFYERVKVLTEKGKDLATVSIPYPKGPFHVTDIKVRTIHSDGTVIPLNVKPEDLLAVKAKDFQVNKMVFTLPSVEVGSILEYRWELAYDDNRFTTPYWQVQQKYYVRKEHFTFIPFKHLDALQNGRGERLGKLLFSTILPPQDKVVEEATGRLFLDTTDVPAIPDEEHMPPLATVAEQVRFYYTSYLTRDEFWKAEGSRWSKEMNRFASESRGLKDAVDTLVTPADSEDQKARKIYAAVMALENTDYTREKSKQELKDLGLKETKTAEDVWKAKTGDSQELALLFIAMARSARIDARPVAVGSRAERIFNANYLSMDQLDHVVVRAIIDGKEVYLDPGVKLQPYGELHWHHTLAGCLKQTAAGTELDYTPASSYKDATVNRVADLTLAADGSITGTIRVDLTGPQALRWRQLAIKNDPEERSKRFEADLGKLVPDGVEVSVVKFAGQDDFNSPLIVFAKVTGSLGTATGKHIFLPGEFFESHASHPFVAQATRQTSVDLDYASSVGDDVTLHLPAGSAVESVPAEVTAPWPGRGLFRTRAVITANSVRLARSLVQASVLVDPSEYPQLHDFYQKIAALMASRLRSRGLRQTSFQ